MTATARKPAFRDGQLTFEDELRRARKAARYAERSRRTYARTLAMLDFDHAAKVLAEEEAARVPAATCRCRGGWTDDGASCGKCGRRLG